MTKKISAKVQGIFHLLWSKLRQFWSFFRYFRYMAEFKPKSEQKDKFKYIIDNEKIRLSNKTNAKNERFWVKTSPILDDMSF